MAKEFHITYSCEINDKNSKFATNIIRKLMKDNGSEFISQNDDYDDFRDVIFHHYTSYDNVIKNCNNIIHNLNTDGSHVSVCVVEHHPSVFIDTKNAINIEELKKFITSILKEDSIISLNNDLKDPNLLKVCFSKSFDRQTFQNIYTSKASQYMKNGHSDVNIFPDWDDVLILQTSTSEEKNNHKKFNF